MSETSHDPGDLEARRETLTAALDTLVPPSSDGRMPGAGEVGLAELVLAALAEDPVRARSVGPLLDRLDRAAGERGAGGFAALDPAARAEVLREAEPQAPEAVGALVFQAFTRYYQQDRALEGLGLEARAPYPRGYEVPDTDFSLLDPVRAREKLWRE